MIKVSAYDGVGKDLLDFGVRISIFLDAFG